MPPKKKAKPDDLVRVWVDGCFDLPHYGHFNALRQSLALGGPHAQLVVGVHNDEEITANKGPPVLTLKERAESIRACKWVHEVVEHAPYYTSVKVLDDNRCGFCVHGDDVTTMGDGRDCYEEVKKAGRYKECSRTKGISTTDIVGRMLLMTKDHHKDASQETVEKAIPSEMSKEVNLKHFLTTSHKITQFSNAREPNKGDKIVYVDGAFDLFHLGHIALLKEAKKLGDYVIVGIHDDRTVNRIKGSNYPIMTLQERVLGVLACRYVDEVIIGAPYTVTQDVLEQVYKVDLVLHGTQDVLPDENGQDPYALPKKLGIYTEVETEFSYMTTETIIERIMKNRLVYEERNKRKQAKAALEREMERAEKAAKQLK